MKHHPFPFVRGNLLPALATIAWISGGGLARATTDLLVSNPSTSSILRFGLEDIVPTGAATTVTDPNPPAGTAFYRIAVKPGSF